MSGVPNFDGFLSLEDVLRNNNIVNDFIDSDDSSLDSFQVVPEIDLDELPQTSIILKEESPKKKYYNIYNNLDKVRSIPMDGDDEDPQISRNLQLLRSNVFKQKETSKTKSRPPSHQISGLFSKIRPSFLSTNTTTTFSASTPVEAVAALKLDDIDARKISIPPTPAVKQVKFPIESILDFDQLEKDLDHNAPLKFNLINRLAQAGGTTYVNLTKNCLTMLLSPNVSSHLNWTGRNGKKAFKNYLIKSVLFDAVRLHFPNVSDYELKDPVQLWFTRGRPRCPSRPITKNSKGHLQSSSTKAGQKKKEASEFVTNFVEVSSNV